MSGSESMADWNCAQTEERLSDYLDGILSSAAAAEFSAHASSCDDCGKLVAQVGGLVHQLRALDALEVPPQLIPKILEGTLGPRRARSAKFVNDLRVVYEIQTRLQPDAEPSPSSTPAPAPPQNSQPPSVNPQEKSQTSPHPGHSQSRNGTMLASLLNTNWAENFGAIVIGANTRSPR